MQEMVALTGNEAAALAFKQIEPDVVAAYPITPQTELMHDVAGFVHDGEMRTEFITVESEHSAMSACIGAAAAGARTMTATSGQGLALMWEMLYIAASYRLPIVMANVNRALSGPINIHCDHSDSMGARDTGWIQLFCENPQEIYDSIIQAIRIAEDKRVQLPLMVCYDGFIISHTMQPLKVLDKETVQKFVGKRQPEFSLLNVEKPFSLGALDLPPYYYEHKRPQVEAMKNALDVVLAVAKEYESLSGRRYGYFEEYRTEDAELLLVGLGSFTGTAAEAVDIARNEGIRAGLLKLRLFRPLPKEALSQALKKTKAACVYDRALSFGLGGPLAHELRSVAYETGLKVPIASAIYGLGGRDITEHDIAAHIRKLWNDYKKDSIKMETEFLNLCE
ncbi:MAG: pyruvate ferredoxin oxidoreductase [Planctomycetota bacterium]|nr:pyruvate ferredoxin oxidoreductase [Planctomycetota bacterium]